MDNVPLCYRQRDRGDGERFHDPLLIRRRRATNRSRLVEKIGRPHVDDIFSSA